MDKRWKCPYDDREDHTSRASERKKKPMTDAHTRSSTRTSKWIKAAPKALYSAFTDPAALAAWQAPGAMTGTVHQFESQVGGGYPMSLYILPLSPPRAAKRPIEKNALRLGFWH